MTWMKAKVVRLMRSACTALLASLLLLIPCLGEGAEAAQLWYKREDLTEEEATRIWLEEIVPYIITDQERRTFESLATPEQRARFIETFWRRRDPDPATPENEFLREHLKRIVYANRMFGAGRPGWRTDRGRIYILLGRPDSVESDPAGYLPHQYPTEVWTYFNPPHPRLPPKLVFAFVDDNFDGEYELTFDLLRDSDVTRRTEALLNTDFFTPMVQAEILAMNLGRSGVFRSRFEGPNPQLSRLHELSVVEQLPELNLRPLETEVTAAVTFTDVFAEAPRAAVEHRVDLFRASDGGVYLPVTLNLSYGDFAAVPNGESRDGSFSVMARIVDKEGEIQDAFVREEYFRVPEDRWEGSEREPLLYEFTLYTEPGDYRLEVVVRDNVNQQSRAFTREVRIPHPPDGLELSSVVVADELLSTGQGRRDGIREPFTFGSYRIIPNFERRFSTGDTLDVYFEVYNLTLDQTGRNSIRIDYRILREARAYRDVPATYPHPAPLDKMHVASSIPLRTFEPGQYTLVVTVTDQVASATASADVEFQIE